MNNRMFWPGLALVVVAAALMAWFSDDDTMATVLEFFN